MKKLMNIRKGVRLFLIITGISVLQSCVVYNPSDRKDIPLSDIVQMSKDGRSSKDIIREIRNSHTIYALRANQIAKLSNEGVPDSVLNYMEKTHIDAVRRYQRMSDSYYGWGGYGYYGGFGFGYPYGFGWPYGWGWGPTIIFSEHRGPGGFHGGFHGGRR
jgi:hypothetical protein